ncbi:MAG: hypothetical protein AB4911_05405 [Oscillochloridaceae bacterium umkhey_bin13]
MRVFLSFLFLAALIGIVMRKRPFYQSQLLLVVVILIASFLYYYFGMI